MLPVKLSIRKIRTKKEREAFFRLRFDIYCKEKNSELGKLNPDDYPDGLEIDEWDGFSIIFGAFNNLGILICALRLIKDSPQLGFRMEVHTDINNFLFIRGINRNAVLQASRMVTMKDYRGLGLMNMVCEHARKWCLRNGYKYWILDPQASLLPKLKDLGWYTEKLTEDNVYFREMRLEPILRYLDKDTKEKAGVGL